MSTQHKMLDLNDDCIYHIYEFLPIIDWCALRETCTRFRTISDYCFSRRSGTFELRDISDTSYSPHSLAASDVKHVLRNFGKFMEALTINKNHFEGNVDCNVLVLFVDRYCESLIDLKLVDINLTMSTIAQCNRLFSTLERLVIDQWDDEKSFSSCLAKCTSLTELEFIRLVIPGDCLAYRHIESLQSFKVSRCDEMSYDAMKCFLTINGQLTQVKLFDLYFRKGHGSRNILTDIAKSLPKLEALSLHFNIEFMPDPLPVVEMASLTKLEANLTYVADSNVNAILQGLTLHNKIEHLHLAQFTCTDESIELLCSMKRLKILKLTDTNQLNADVCKRLATRLSDLDEIHIIECKDTSFNEVKEFCVHVPNLKKIIFNRPDDASPSITQEMFSSLVNIRRNQPTKKMLLIFLNDDDLREIKSEFKWSGMEDTLVKQENVLKLVPLEKEHRSTVYEYGSGFRYHSKQFLDDIDVEDESGSDDSSFDGSDDHWVFG
ncbi:uncharacterized protein LOC119066456 [Bradysia coprophila]|uniref:uncharacterized protein LOC119066456 n=1 Tax=Bradysia coprophila TaxID=38358 RepID=UPI00187D9E93|nr:uncharacterized protein LOC119066456 [Bradysia coprophila]XP_037024855.1 uncharacterized protein LOC119066456 [Bradysia coprophila]XP_037024856.1 uncharacterized protein LOC119066456 [Bradysia coprophila]